MKQFVTGLVLVIAIAATTYMQTKFLSERPTILKLGPVPHAGLLKTLAGEHRTSLAMRSVIRVMFYFGSFFEPDDNRLQDSPEYFNMFQHLVTSVKLDPYNIDAYYFSQAAFTWEIGQAKAVNELLDYGMQYRTWDYWLPFYAGFNAAYFLKDYAKAAEYMRIAAEMSNNSLFTNLAARYFHEAGEAGLGLVFLETMAKGAKSEKVRRIYELRIEALKAVRQIEEAMKEFVLKYNKRPAELNILVENNLLLDIPRDPYGGEFYLDESGKVRTTSQFALTSGDPENSKKSLETVDSINYQKDNH